jgi:hypothetical protein
MFLANPAAVKPTCVRSEGISVVAFGCLLEKEVVELSVIIFEKKLDANVTSLNAAHIQ